MHCKGFKIGLFFIAFTLFGYCQNLNEKNLKILDSLIASKQFKKAEALTKFHIDSLIKKDKFYDATDYVYYLGTIENKLSNTNKAISKIKEFENYFLSQTENLKARRQLALEIGSVYETFGDSETAKNYNHKALEITKKMPDATGKDFALIQSNIGVFNSRLGNIPEATKFHRLALKSLESNPSAEKESFYISYNSLGGMMWYASKLDSAIYYYQKAEKVLKTLEETPLNKYYRSASLNNNIAGVYSIQGNIDAAVSAMKTTVNNLSTYLKENEISDIKRKYAREFYFQAIDNYAGLYKELKDFQKAKQLLNYAYTQKKKFLNTESAEISKSKILLGEINQDLKNYIEAEKLLDEGISELEAIPGNYTYWLADAYYYKALLSFNMSNSQKGLEYLSISEKLFEESFQGYYDEIYLDFIVNASFFYAKYGNSEKALKMGHDALNYIIENQGEKTLLEYYQVLNLAEIHFELKNFNKALTYSDKAIQLLNSKDFQHNNQLRIEISKVDALILKMKLELKLKLEKDKQFLEQKLKEINKAIKILEKNKSILSDEGSASILIQDNVEIFNLAKNLNLQLYEITKDSKYLENLLGYHESMIYQKIRSRLNSKSSQLTGNLPKEIIDKERELKSSLNNLLDAESNFNKFLEYQDKWTDFLNMLKSEYPKYYELKYASIFQSLNNISSKVDSKSTIVRFLFLDEALYAFVINNAKIEMVKIESLSLDSKIKALNHSIQLLETTYNIQKELYDILWQPITNYIKTTNVTIIPDQELFNLSFELLTPKILNSFTGLVENSLLSDYNISYNYSLFLIDKDSKPIDYNSNFIAFAPEFNESMKSDYKVTIVDTVELDHTYLKLLPQPFAREIAVNYSELFNGDSFLNEKASKQIFTNNAGEHKIIHIGTHAESDNISPEFSRLIFAKNQQEKDNSLYTFEIYNQDLSSNLAILTACETGKPTYQPGEGMISLANAFNYAGSESILTSLWEIDEQSSAQILKLFYNNISEGLPKDEALKQAKLSYLKKSKGRTISPQYWAGLVLIGNTYPIEINTKSYRVYWIIGIVLFLLLILLFKRANSLNKKSLSNKERLSKYLSKNCYYKAATCLVN